MGGEKIMDHNRKNYIRISKESGCIISNYNIENYDEQDVVIPYDTKYKSGEFRMPRKRGSYTNNIDHNL